MWSCPLDLLLLPGLWRPHPSAIAYCNTQAKRRHVSHRPMGACGAFFSLLLVSKRMRTSRWWCVSCGSMEFILWYLPGTACLYSGPSPANLACLRNYLLHACRYWYCGCHPHDTAGGRDRTRDSFSIRAVVYGFSSNMPSKLVGLRRIILVFICIFYATRTYQVFFTRTRMISTYSSYVVWDKTRMRCGLLYYF